MSRYIFIIYWASWAKRDSYFRLKTNASDERNGWKIRRRINSGGFRKSSRRHLSSTQVPMSVKSSWQKWDIEIGPDILDIISYDEFSNYFFLSTWRLIAKYTTILIGECKLWILYIVAFFVSKLKVNKQQMIMDWKIHIF